ncbi:group II intron maturase-specific domain-containing protein [Nocardia sp. CA-107356]|uniref:group II intron maturase-specific domain-containing protein n=1 Tax=Nocardia sp. CA-107356 TaxID=3239972 RepID=UPI003D915666
MRFPLALNENPYGPLPSVRRALTIALGSASRYPEFLPHRLPQLIAARIGCSPEQIVVGAGATGVIMHILQAYLFMHYAFDSWLEREFPTVEFERFTDDAVVHCVTERQARQVWVALSERLESVGLRLHPDKTKIVYCKDKNRRQEFACTSFTFLGYAFRPREAKSGRTGRYFASFQPAVSPVALKDKSLQVRRWRMHRHTTNNLAELAEWINPIVRGWMNYYGAFYRSELYGVLQRLNTYLVRWAGKKFKRLRVYKRCKVWWERLVERQPDLFAHWAWMRAFSWAG